MSRGLRALFALLFVACLVAATQPFWKRLLPRPPAPQVAQPVQIDDFGPCLDRRPPQPDAPDIPGLNPRTLLFSSDCRWLIAGNQNGSIQLIDRRSGKLLAEAAAHAFRVENLFISPDDRLLFSSSQTQEDVMVWSLPELKRIGVVKTSRHGSSALAYDARRSLLVTGTSSDLNAWKIAFDKPGEAQFAEPLFSQKARGAIQSLAFSPDGALLAAGAGGAVQLWRTDGNGFTPVGASGDGNPREWIVALAFTRDAKAIVSGTRSKKIEVWQVPSLEPVRQVAGDPPRWDFYTDPTRFTARPPRDYTGADRTKLIFEVDDAIADRLYLASVGRYFNEPIAWRGKVQAAANSGGISFFDIYASRPGPVLSIPSRQSRGSMLNFAVLPARSLLAVKRGFDLMVIDLARLEVLKTHQMAGGKAELQWIADGRYLVYSNHLEVGFVTPETGEVRKVPRPLWNGEAQMINHQLGASLDGKGVAAIFGDRLVEIGPDLQVKEIAKLPLMKVELVAPIASKKAYLLAGPTGGALFGNPAASAALPTRIVYAVNAALAPDGRTLYVKEDEKLCRYLVDAPAPCEKIAQAENPGWMALDSDGKLLVEGGQKKKVRVLELASGKDLASLEGHLGEIAYVKLLSGRVLSIDKTGELRLWALDTRQLLASARP